MWLLSTAIETIRRNYILKHLLMSITVCMTTNLKGIIGEFIARSETKMQTVHYRYNTNEIG